MKKILFYALLITYLLPVNGQTVSKGSVIGRTYKRISEIEQFKNYKEEQGILILPLGTGNGFSKISDGKNTVVLFTKYIAPKSYKILAVLDLEKIDVSNIKVGMARCRVNTKDDGKVVALIKPSGGQYLKNIVKAWRVDEKKHTFIPIPVKGIDCENETDGL